MEPGYVKVCIVYLSILTFFVGRIVGKKIDKQYREPEGKPILIPIPLRWKRFFSFSYFVGNEAVKAGVAAHIIGYIFAVLEFLCLIGTFFENGSKISLFVAFGLFVLFFLILVFAVALPMSIRYNRNIQKILDCDWITQLQEAFTVLPKRRCRIIKSIDEKTCEIALGRLGRRRFLAKTSFPVTVGEKWYAVHSNEQGSPFWTVRDH